MSWPHHLHDVVCPNNAVHFDIRHNTGWMTDQMQGHALRRRGPLRSRFNCLECESLVIYTRIRRPRQAVRVVSVPFPMGQRVSRQRPPDSEHQWPEDEEKNTFFCGLFVTRRPRTSRTTAATVTPPPPSSFGTSWGTQGGRSRDSDTCYKCGSYGHWAADCPNKRSRAQDICYKCRLPGHWAVGM
ncbi:hypothetical protein B0H12DRAFT_751352 [Mycena haematopus]|nr:hypothetical protein B0H12DRAFT_604389 [Mycena haematopus]KAJ7246914.1 hypothetical protein B0H12DRAFT_751352 [Mycena haematopus]